MIASGGFLTLLVLSAPWQGRASVWPWLLGWAVMAALLTRQAGLTGQGYRRIVAASGLSLGIVLYWPVLPTGVSPWLCLGLLSLAHASEEGVRLLGPKASAPP